MDILMASSELAPVAKVGGLADAVAALSKTLCQFDHQVTVALPRYRAIEEAGLMLARRLTPIRLTVGDEEVQVTLFDGRLGAGVELLLLDIEGLYDRPGIYGEGGQDYEDNAVRFGLFCRAVAEVVAKRAEQGRPFDAVHAHDWPTALVPFLLRDRDVRTVLTVHSVARQGQFSKDALEAMGLDWDDFHPAGLEFYGELNLLKAGVLAADAVAAVSPTFAQDLQTSAGGGGLDGVFQARSADLVGILNGIDYAVWSPSVDHHLPTRFDAEDMVNKGRCKAGLLHELELDINPERPLVVFTGPLTHDKGVDRLVEALEPIARTGAQVVVAGDGPADEVGAVEQAADRLTEDVRFLGAASDSDVHRLIAAADIVLLPDRSAPCGIIQQAAQRYGALPVAHAVGGLRDSIVDCDAHLATGTGFVFDEPSAAGLVGAVQRAVAARRSPDWAALQRRVMRLDLSWERPARRYAKLYQQAESGD